MAETKSELNKVPSAKDHAHVMESGIKSAVGIPLSQEEIEINERIDANIMKNPERMPVAVYFIVPNEFAERFCFYGISPLLNKFFRNFCGLGKVRAMEIRHAFNALAYITPLVGAAMSDSKWGKYKTIVYL